MTKFKHFTPFFGGSVDYIPVYLWDIKKLGGQILYRSNDPPKNGVIYGIIFCHKIYDLRNVTHANWVNFENA